jgi:hypothetical protein
MAQLYLVCTEFFKIWSPFKVQLPLQLEDSGKSLLSKWRAQTANCQDQDARFYGLIKEEFMQMGFEF